MASPGHCSPNILQRRVDARPGRQAGATPPESRHRLLGLIRFLFWKFDPISTRLTMVIGHYLEKGADVALFTPEIVASLFTLMAQNRGVLPILHTFRIAIEHDGHDARLLVRAGIIEHTIAWHTMLVGASLQRMCQSLLRAVCRHSGLPMAIVLRHGVRSFLSGEATDGSFHRTVQAMMTWVAMLALATPDEIDRLIEQLFVDQVIDLIESLEDIELHQCIRDLIEALRRENPERRLRNALSAAGIGSVLAPMIETRRREDTISLLVQLDEATRQ